MSTSEYFEEMLARLLDARKGINPSQVSELSDLSSAQARAFKEAWPHSEPGRRREIVRQLGQLAEENLELLFERVNRIVLEDEDPTVRRRAIANLWEAEDGPLGRALATIARDDPDHEVRCEAVRALGRFVYLGEVKKISAEDHEIVEETLLAILKEGSSDSLRRQALESLGYSSRNEIQSHIQTSYDSDDEPEIRSGLIAMGRSADRSWLPAIRKYLDHPSPDLRGEAARAAGELEAHNLTDRLIELLEDGNEGVRKAAIWSLGQVGGRRAREALIEVQESGRTAGHEREIGEALDHIAFLEGTPDLMTYDLDYEDDGEE